jgi:hypothetical protein
MEAVMTRTAKKSVVKTPETAWDRMTMAERLALFEKIEKNAPKNVPLTDEEIQEEVNMVRYGNKNGKPNRNWERDLALLTKAGF